MATGKQTRAKHKTFRSARERLDEILDELEHDAGDVDQLAARVKEAGELIRFCRERLQAARHEVTEVVAALGAEVDVEAAATSVTPATPATAGDDERPPDVPPPDYEAGDVPIAEDDLPF